MHRSIDFGFHHFLVVKNDGCMDFPQLIERIAYYIFFTPAENYYNNGRREIFSKIVT